MIDARERPQETGRITENGNEGKPKFVVIAGFLTTENTESTENGGDVGRQTGAGGTPALQRGREQAGRLRYSGELF